MLQQEAGIQGFRCASNDSLAVQQVLKEVKPDVCMFDRFVMEEQFGHAVHSFNPNIVSVLDTQDFHALRLGRQALVETGQCATSVHQAAEFLPKPGSVLSRELASVHRCDLSLFCSTAELQLMRFVYGVPSYALGLASFFYEQGETERDTVTGITYDTDLPGFEDRKHFVSLGNFRHPPNRYVLV